MIVFFSLLPGVPGTIVLSKVSCSFYNIIMYLNSFVSRTRHNFLCICSQICISKEYFRFSSGLRGLFDNKSPIISLGLLQTSPDRMVCFNSLRGTNTARNGAQNLLRETQTSLRGTSNHSNVILTLLRQTQTSLRGTNYHSNVILTLLQIIYIYSNYICSNITLLLTL